MLPDLELAYKGAREDETQGKIFFKALAKLQILPMTQLFRRHGPTAFESGCSTNNLNVRRRVAPLNHCAFTSEKLSRVFKDSKVANEHVEGYTICNKWRSCTTVGRQASVCPPHWVNASLGHDFGLQ